MKEEDRQLDVRLNWRETQTRRDGARDSVSVTADRGESRVEPELEVPDDHGPDEAEQTLLAQEQPELESEEEFQWSADRERALTEALQQAPEGAVPRVHLQLQAITQGLEAKSLQPERALELLSEVEAYLSARLQAEHRKAQVKDELFMQSRTDKINSLYAYQESNTALAEYCRQEDPLQLKVAAYAADQGQGFLAASRQALMQAEPEFVDDDDDEYEYEDEEDEDEDDEDYDEDEEYEEEDEE